MRGLDNLQDILDKLPVEDPSCRDAWCGRWERNGGVYQPHTPADHLAENALIDGSQEGRTDG